MSAVGLQRGSRLFEAIYSRVVLGNPWVHAALLHLLLPDENTDVDLLGTRLRINKRKEAGYWRAASVARSSSIFFYEASCLLSLALVLRPGDTFVDVGANVGLYSAALGRVRTLHPSVRFYAFEANADTATRLRATVKDRDVDVFDVALSNHDGPLTFVSGTTSLTFGVAQSDAKLQLKQLTVPLHARRLDAMDIVGDSLVLKIDVENHERQVLEGAAGLFDAGRVKAVFIDSYADSEVPRFLTRRGFALFDATTMAPGPSPRLLAIRTEESAP